jgi:hypothetical protein
VLTAKSLTSGERQTLQDRVLGLVEKHGFKREDLIREVRRVLPLPESVGVAGAD